MATGIIIVQVRYQLSQLMQRAPQASCTPSAANAHAWTDEPAAPGFRQHRT
jgi:hypothetical protein